mmetsp:Transcript_22042/g.63018  ORF Transcript_22042/g.63018 Transcript_22042/m.63018 type:complete len:290 (-) Transcript_22042:481-1350(-)
MVPRAARRPMLRAAAPLPQDGRRACPTGKRRRRRRVWASWRREQPSPLWATSCWAAPWASAEESTRRRRSTRRTRSMAWAAWAAWAPPSVLASAPPASPAPPCWQRRWLACPCAAKWTTPPSSRLTECRSCRRSLWCATGSWCRHFAGRTCSTSSTSPWRSSASRCSTPTAAGAPPARRPPPRPPVMARAPNPTPTIVRNLRRSTEATSRARSTPPALFDAPLCFVEVYEGLLRHRGHSALAEMPVSMRQASRKVSCEAGGSGVGGGCSHVSPRSAASPENSELHADLR